MRTIERFASNGMVRILVYIIFMAGFYFAMVKELPGKVENHDKRIATMEVKQDSMEESLDKIESRTEAIYQILLTRGRGR